MTSNAGFIEHPEKIGIGTWDADKIGTAVQYVNDMGFGWHYNWKSVGLWDPDKVGTNYSAYIPMIWDEADITATKLSTVASSGATELLTFNEPDLSSQADMTVQQAIDLWPQLQATGLMLSSPAVTKSQTLGNGTWLSDFMQKADAKGYRVDFIAVHYYSASSSVTEFKQWLIEVYETYGRPIWVTEWALIDWDNNGRYSESEIATFAREATLMMDDLDFVEKHAWFSSYNYSTGIETNLFDADGDLTAVGHEFTSLLGEIGALGKTFIGSMNSDIVAGTRNSDKLSGGAKADQLEGFAATDILVGGGGSDMLRGGAGNDTLRGGTGGDTLRGSWGNDHIRGGNGDDKLTGGHGKDILTGGLGSDQFIFTMLSDSSFTATKPDEITDFVIGEDRIDLSAIDAIAGGTDNKFVLNSNSSFSVGEIRQTVINGNLLLELNTDYDAEAEFSLQVNGYTRALTSTDILF